MSGVRSTTGAPRVQPLRGARPAQKAQPASATSAPTRSAQLNQAAAQLNDDKAVGLTPLPTAQPQSPKAADPRAEERKKDPRASILGDNPRFKELYDSERQLQEIKDRKHSGLNQQLDKIDATYNDEMKRLEKAREQERADIARLRDEARDHLSQVREDVRTNYKAQRKEASQHHRQYSEEKKALKKENPEAYKALDKILLAEHRKATYKTEKGLAAADRFHQKSVARLKEEFGIEPPTSAEMEKYAKEGPPKGDSLKDKAHRILFNRRQVRDIRSKIPATKEERAAHLARTEESTKKKRSQLDERSKKVEPTFQKYAKEYKTKQTEAKEKAKSDLVSSLRKRVKANQTFSKAELPEHLQKSVGLAEVSADAKFKLDGDKLVVEDGIGRPTTIRGGKDHATIFTKDDTMSRSSTVHSDGREPSTEVGKNEYGQKVEINIRRSADGKQSRVKTTDQVGRQRVEVERTENGKEVYSSTESREKGRVTYKKEKETEYKPDGNVVTKVTMNDHDDQKTRVTNEARNPEGKLIGRSEVETTKTKHGERTRTEVMLDSSTGKTRITDHSVERRDGKRVETTAVTEGKTDNDGYVKHTATTSVVKETTHESRYANSDEKDLPGLGWVPWDSPQDLMNDMESRGGAVKIQKVEREVTGPDGKKRTENITQFSNRNNQLQLTKGPDGKNIWTHKVKNSETGKWDSQTFFQGSDDDTIVTKNSVENRGGHKYEVERTSLEMKDNPGAEKSRVPQKGDYTVSKTEKADMAEVQRVAKEIGFSSKELEEMASMKLFQDKFGKAKDLKIEIKTSEDRFADSSKNKKGASVVVTGPDGAKLVLSRDQLKDLGGIRAEWKDENGKLMSHESMTAEGEVFEEVHEAGNVADARAEAIRKSVAPYMSQDIRDNFKHGEFALKVGNKAFRASGRLSGAGLKKAAPGLDLISGGLATISAAHDFANGEVARGVKNLGGAAADYGMAVRAYQALKYGDKLGKGLGTGAGAVVKKFGVAGAAVGVVSGTARLIDGEYVGGGLDLLSSGFAGAAIFGVPGVGWAAGVAALGAAVWDYRNDTVIAEPKLTR